jgi:hypothetical protein
MHDKVLAVTSSCRRHISQWPSAGAGFVRHWTAQGEPVPDDASGAGWMTRALAIFKVRIDVSVRLHTCIQPCPASARVRVRHEVAMRGMRASLTTPSPISVSAPP